MLRTVHAELFHHELAAGRTRPVVLGCRNTDGSDGGEFVVKLHSELAAQGGNSSFEVYGILLAQHFDIATPEAVLVQLDAQLAEAIPGEFGGVANRIKSSTGLNFGTRFLTGYRTWLRGQSIPAALRSAALDLFTFDTLIQNPDRGDDRPNLLTGNDRILAIDHDSAFSFVHALGDSGDPCNLHQLPFLERHVFYSQLKGKPVDLQSFRARLLTMDETLPGILAAAPASWNPSYRDRIESQLMAARENADRFCEAITWRLAK